MIDRFTFSIPQLSPEMERRAYVCLPEGYELSEDERYPVLYMFDGQNLFSDEEAATVSRSPVPTARTPAASSRDVYSLLCMSFPSV